MNKQNLLLFLDKVSYLAIINATIFVVLFQFLSAPIFVYVSMFSYLVAFLMSILFCVFRIYYAKTNTEEIYAITKKQKIWLIAKIILSFVLFSVSLVIALLW